MIVGCYEFNNKELILMQKKKNFYTILEYCEQILYPSCVTYIYEDVVYYTIVVSKFPL